MDGPLACAGENDGMAVESEIAGAPFLEKVIVAVQVVSEWASAVFLGKHAVMSDLAYATVKSETNNAWPFEDHGSRACGSLHEGYCWSCSRTCLYAPLGDVFSIVSREQAFKVLVAYAFTFCFRSFLAAMSAACGVLTT